MRQAIVIDHPTQVWTTSDTHFDHANIIKYCRRPYRDTTQMNLALIANWNRVVGKDDTVLFLGDLAFGSHRKSALDYLSRLRGRKIMVRGNHDWGSNMKGIELFDQLDITCGSERFLATHDPWLVHERERWVLHGHTHEGEPAYDLDNGLISACVEVTNYYPVQFIEIMTRIAQWRVAHPTIPLEEKLRANTVR
jgi:calcineurin-like phosphoesterase family protein